MILRAPDNSDIQGEIVPYPGVQISGLICKYAPYLELLHYYQYKEITVQYWDHLNACGQNFPDANYIFSMGGSKH